LVLRSVSCLLSASVDHEANRVVVPETKRLTLEEMDLVFGSSGVAAADRERMAQINREIGLHTHVNGEQQSDDGKEQTALG
jgi:general stress protein YciG